MKYYIDLKYRLKDKLHQLPYNDYYYAVKGLPGALKISESTFRRYLNTKIDEKYSMPADHMAILAKFLKCRMEDLLNYNPPPIKIRGIYTDAEFAWKFGLVK